MAELVMLSATAATNSGRPIRAVGARVHSNTVLPTLDLLDHTVTWLPADVAAYSTAPAYSLVLVDTTGDLAAARAGTQSQTGNQFRAGNQPRTDDYEHEEPDEQLPDPSTQGCPRPADSRAPAQPA